MAQAPHRVINPKLVLFTALLAPILCTESIGAEAYDKKITSFTFNITNDSSADFTFKLDQKNRKKIDMYVNDSKKKSMKISAGSSGTLILQPSNTNECNTDACGSCVDSKGRIDAYYEDGSGNLVMNDFFETPYVLTQECQVNIVVYTSSWEFHHHEGDGDDYYPHSQKSKTPGYSSSDTYTFEAGKTDASATITYSDPDGS